MPPFRTVPGRVIESTLHASATPEGQRRTQVVVQYIYEVGGVRYIGNQIYANPISEALSGANSRRRFTLLARYPQDAPVTVYYDVHTPSRTFLERGLSDDVQVLAIVIGVMLIIGALALLAGTQGSLALLGF